MALSDSHRQLLVRCRMRNRDGETSVRFVEQSLFRLWQYMMANKHALVVTQVDLCLWLPAEEWRAQQALFEHVGPEQQVQRICLAVFDPVTGLCSTLQRFVAAEDVERVKGLLLDRIPLETRQGDDFAMEVEHGIAVLRGEAAELATLGYALDGSTPRP
ncbi:MAG: hypothetical protein R3E86_10035 [Pseudomonadales bacterium]